MNAAASDAQAGSILKDGGIGTWVTEILSQVAEIG